MMASDGRFNLDLLEVKVRFVSSGLKAIDVLNTIILIDMGLKKVKEVKHGVFEDNRSAHALLD